jgi:hypothetical protein
VSDDIVRLGMLNPGVRRFGCASDTIDFHVHPRSSLITWRTSERVPLPHRHLHSFPSSRSSMNATLSPTSSPKVRRRASTRRARAGSHLPPVQTPETHESALSALRAFLKGRICYDAFPISFRVIVLDTKLEIKKALQCLLNNGALAPAFAAVLCTERIVLTSTRAGVVSAPLWNSEKSCFAGMFTVQDIIHLIQWYYRTSSYDTVVSEVENFRLESLRGPSHDSSLFVYFTHRDRFRD